MKVVAFERSAQGTGASRRLRIAGKTPGIIYGGASAPQTVELDHNALFHALKKEVFHSSILDLEVAGQVQKVLLRDFQMHPYKQLVLHVDFQRVDPNKKLHVKVPLHFVGVDVSPGVKSNGGIVSHVFNELEIQCLPNDLPEYIEIDLSQADIGFVLHAKEVSLPKGVNLMPHLEQENPVLVTIKLPSAEKETPAAVEAAPAADTGTDTPAPTA